jgi:hypothetical protein
LRFWHEAGSQPARHRAHHRAHAAVSRPTTALAVMVLIAVGAVLLYSVALTGQGGPTSSASSSLTTSESTVKGVVAGYVTVGPSQPACGPNQSCTEELSGYSLEFASQCPTTSTGPSAACEVQVFGAPIAPSGHYSILLPPGNFTIIGLSPPCSWVGCSSTFPKTVNVVAGQQLIVNVDIDTGIR